jgi:hypothetical protein
MASNTRYKTPDALKCNSKRQTRHEHVYPRSRLIDAFIAKPEALDEILINAIGCTVTIDEHLRLTPFDRLHEGWERYRRADVTVLDTQTGKELSVDEMPKLPI